MTPQRRPGNLYELMGSLKPGDRIGVTDRGVGAVRVACSNASSVLRGMRDRRRYRVHKHTTRDGREIAVVECFEEPK